MGEEGQGKVLEEGCKTAAENLAENLARCNHQVVQKNTKRSAAQGKPLFRLFSEKKEGWETEICLKEGSESDTPETVTQHLNFILLPILHSDRPDS